MKLLKGLLASTKRGKLCLCREKRKKEENKGQRRRWESDSVFLCTF